MNDETQIIIQYLNHEMNAEERRAFEARLQKDSELAEEVEIYRGLQGFLQREDVELNQKLEKLSDEYAKKKTTPSFLPIIITIVSLSVIALIYFIFFSNKKPELPNNNTLTPILDTIEQIDNNSRFEEIDTTSKDPIPTNPTIEKPQKVDDAQPIASLDEADFEPSPILENLMAKNVRDSDTKPVTVIKPLPNTNFNYEKMITFNLIGTTQAKPAYRLKLYTNKSSEIENDRTILNELIKNNKKGDEFEFQFNAIIPLNRGLYYFIIQQEKNERILYVSKFTVR